MGSETSKPVAAVSEVNHGQQIIENVAVLHTDVTSTYTKVSIGLGIGLIILLGLLIYICMRMRNQSKYLKRSIIPQYIPLQAQKLMLETQTGLPS